MVLMLFVIVGTLRRWVKLLGIEGTVTDAHGVQVKTLVEE